MNLRLLYGTVCPVIWCFCDFHSCARHNVDDYSCQLTLLFLTLAFKACLENLRLTLSDVYEREGITNFTASSASISPSFLSLPQCSGYGDAVLSSPWVPFYYFCIPPDFAVLSKASACSLSLELLALGACCSIKAKSWKYVGFMSPWGYC